MSILISEDGEIPGHTITYTFPITAHYTALYRGYDDNGRPVSGLSANPNITGTGVPEDEKDARIEDAISQAERGITASVLSCVHPVTGTHANGLLYRRIDWLDQGCRYSGVPVIVRPSALQMGTRPALVGIESDGVGSFSHFRSLSE